MNGVVLLIMFYEDDLIITNNNDDLDFGMKSESKGALEMIDVPLFHKLCNWLMVSSFLNQNMLWISSIYLKLNIVTPILLCFNWE